MIRLLVVRIVLAALIASLAAGFIATHQVSAAELRRSIEVGADVVTLGDLFTGAGDRADRPVFRAPNLGVTGALPANDAIQVAIAAGLAIDRLPTFATVSVVRRSTMIDDSTMTSLVAAAAAARLGVAEDNLDVGFDAGFSPVAADASAADPAVVTAFTLQSGSGRFTAHVAIDVGSRDVEVDVAGRVVEIMAIPVLSRPVGRRDVIRMADLGTVRMDKRRVPGNAILDASELVDMAARRPLRAGEAIAAGDIEPPRLVLRGDIVTVQYLRPGLTLNARGRAITDGAKGDLISILNEQSKRTIQGVVTGSGVVEVSGSSGPAVVASAQN